VFSNVWGVIGEPILGALVNMVIYTKGAVPIMPFALSNRTEFGDAMCDVMGDLNAVVWANHGLLTVGPDLRTAFKTSVAVESAAKVLLHARSVTDKPIVLYYTALGVTESL
jgi:ribulose-5-phosphate 4-epimerase/fuculose-1-phosphate aldolase